MNQDEASLAGSDEASMSRRVEAAPGPAGRDEVPSPTGPIGNSSRDNSSLDDAPEGEVTDAPRGRDYTSAVYGSVLAATVVVSSGDLRSPAALSTLLIVSGIVFWIAHVYAATVSGRHGGWHLGSIRTGMKHEWPVAFAAVPPAIAAAVSGLLPHVSVTDGVWAALVVAIGEQQIWGYAAVRHAKLKGPALTGTILLNVFMGFIIVGLKFAVGGH
jgi:hypothetical protein